MYNTKVVCTYHTNEVFLESDQITDEDRYFVRDAIYRQEVLDILGMEDYNEAEMLRTVHDLFQKVGECDELKEFGLKLAGHFMSNDSEFGLMLLFAFDFMYLTHICISEYLDTGKMSEQNILNLREVVFRHTF
jgi:hypothetical protein